MIFAMLGFFSPVGHPVHNSLYLNGQKLSIRAKQLIFTFGGGAWLDVVQYRVRLKNEIKAKFYSKGRTLVVLICEFSSKNNFSIQTLKGFVVPLVSWAHLHPQTSQFHSLTAEKSTNNR